MEQTFSFAAYKKIFDDYAAHYNIHDGRVALKITHTDAVVSVMEQLCTMRGLSEHTKNMALLCALFHDIGRFEQLKQYGTFLDYKSIDHAELSCRVLLENNILSIYAKLYHKYEADKSCIPAGNLIEVKFEDFEADAMGMTEKIYHDLSIPGFAEARSDIEKYVGGKKGYKKNKYKYDDRTVQLVQDNWNFALDQWNYEL